MYIKFLIRAYFLQQANKCFILPIQIFVSVVTLQLWPMPTQIQHLDHTTVAQQFPTHVSLETFYKEIANWDVIQTRDNGMEVLLSVKEVYVIFIITSDHGAEHTFQQANNYFILLIQIFVSVVTLQLWPMPTQIHHLDHTTVVLQFPTHVSLDTLYKEIANWDAIQTPDDGMEILLSVKEVYLIFSTISWCIKAVHYFSE